MYDKMFDGCHENATATAEQIDAVQKVIDEIYSMDYYAENWGVFGARMNHEGITVGRLLAPFQHFWESLPDSFAIHRGPYYKICDLAEIYCFGLIQDDPEPLFN